MVLFGYKVVINKGYQKQTLSRNVVVTDEFRKKTNDWLAGFFGYHQILKDGETLKCEQEKTIVMNQSTFDRLKKEIDARDFQQIRSALTQDVHRSFGVPYKYL